MRISLIPVAPGLMKAKVVFGKSRASYQFQHPHPLFPVFKLPGAAQSLPLQHPPSRCLQYPPDRVRSSPHFQSYLPPIPVSEGSAPLVCADGWASGVNRTITLTSFMVKRYQGPFVNKTHLSCILGSSKPWNSGFYLSVYFVLDFV